MNSNARGQAVEFRDHPLLDRFPDSEITEVEFDQDVNYRLVLSSLQRTRGLVSPEVSERLRGDVTKIVYEVSEEFNGQDVYDYFREQLGERGYTELFTCAGRECGSSNYWANDIFRNRILYGPERNQFYVAMRAGQQADMAPHIALYIITRGNRRLYAYLEIIEVGGAETRIDVMRPADLVTTLQSQEAIVITDIEFENDLALTSDSDLSAVVGLLQADPSLRIYLVAHLSGEADLDALIQRSQQRANVLRQLLIGRGVDANRIIARGIGPLAPACNAEVCGDRVEIVLQ
ncbi:MAG: DUF4892 domain-containing protein [Gammaproteobacteria bacterium]|nr:DUF4892 domain-containing protein [Gammaproteobacteria bacterium]MDD9896752.1 DUF4892 domain-containing protein [Gammaproteobacteria bacterium]MDD9959677.1 DUF4892 domain-containing protein [Gammaproteobacteria bacterium]